MNSRSSFLFLLIALSPFLANTQSPNTIGYNYIIQSTVYESDRHIQIYTPEGYDSSSKDYTVLYLLDGQSWYLQAVSYQRLFQTYGYTPDFIVVGVDTNDSGRYGFFSDTEKLIKFLETEVISLVENKFRTSKERLLFGWQFAGTFALKTMSIKPELFNGYLTASPIPIDQRNSLAFSETKTLFITTSHVEDQVNNGVKEFVIKLDSAPTSLRWQHKTHGT